MTRVITLCRGGSALRERLRGAVRAGGHSWTTGLSINSLTVRIQVRLMDTPPSARSAEPVVKLDASDAR
jgi:hypothetical protein